MAWHYLINPTPAEYHSFEKKSDGFNLFPPQDTRIQHSDLFIRFVCSTLSSLLREASISSLTSLKFLPKLVMAGSNLITQSLFSSADRHLKYFNKNKINLQASSFNTVRSLHLDLKKLIAMSADKAGSCK